MACPPSGERLAAGVAGIWNGRFETTLNMWNVAKLSRAGGGGRDINMCIFHVLRLAIYFLDYLT